MMWIILHKDKMNRTRINTDHIVSYGVRAAPYNTTTLRLVNGDIIEVAETCVEIDALIQDAPPFLPYEEWKEVKKKLDKRLMGPVADSYAPDNRLLYGGSAGE